MSEYAAWIAVKGDVLGKCAEVTLAMVVEFPELKRVRGFYDCPFWGRREHWWCVTPDRSIVDPTVMQFPSKGMGEYIEHVEGSPEPTGKCPDCGEYVYDGNTFCNLTCQHRTEEYLGIVFKV